MVIDSTGAGLGPRDRAEGWREHDGGDCPVRDGGLVEVRLRDGRYTFSRFGFWYWTTAHATNIDIVAFRAPGENDRLAA
jgi:hypothetical protein